MKAEMIEMLESKTKTDLEFKGILTKVLDCLDRKMGARNRIIRLFKESEGLPDYKESIGLTKEYTDAEYEFMNLISQMDVRSK